MKRMKRRYAEGGDVEDLEPGEGTARRDVGRSFERIGKSALEEGEEEFARTVAKRRAATAKPSPRAEAKAESKPATVRDEGKVPVGEEERKPRADSRPQARQPSGLERAVEALPVGKIGAGIGALATGVGAAYSGYKAAKKLKEASRLRNADSVRSYERAREAQRGDMGTAAEFLKNYRQSQERMERGLRASREAGEQRRFAREASGMTPRRGGQPESRPSGVSFGFKKGGSVSAASSRGDGIAQKGKTKGRMV